MKYTVDTMMTLLQDQGYCSPKVEFYFHPTRKWRFDYCWPEWKVAFEVEGVTAQGGRHQRIGGFSKDVEKYNEAIIMGWRLIRATPKQIASGQALAWLERALKS